MEIYLIIIAIILLIILLFILYRIIFKKILKQSLFDGVSGLFGIVSQRTINIGQYSNKGAVYKADSNEKPSENFLAKNDKPLVDDKKKPKKKSLLKKDNNNNSKNTGLINRVPKKIESPENAVKINKEESIKKTSGENKANAGLKVNSFEDIYKFLENSGNSGSLKISEIVRYFEMNNLKLINSMDNGPRFSSPADFEASIKNNIINFLNNQYEDLMYKLSQLRKNGKNVRDAEFILLSIPLKIKLFSVTFSKKDFDLVIKKIESIKVLIKDYG
jgi:hypothetical protein